MDLIIIRHGESEADILKVHEGRADFNLTEKGHKQAELMANWVSNYIELDKIIASPLKRAAQTAEKLATATNLPIQFRDELMEWQNGLMAGMSFEEANIKYPEPTIKYPHTAVYGQESNVAFRARAELILSEIIHEEHPGAKIAIVSHGNMITRLFQSFMGVPIDSDVQLFTGDTGIHHLKIGWNKKIAFLNYTGHLDKM